MRFGRFGERPSAEHAEHSAADQDWKAQEEQMVAELAVLDRAGVGEGPEVPEDSGPKKWQRTQDADRSKSEHDEPEDSHARRLLPVR